MCQTQNDSNVCSPQTTFPVWHAALVCGYTYMLKEQDRCVVFIIHLCSERKKKNISIHAEFLPKMTWKRLMCQY